jgi:hypothetical protein
MLVLEHKGDKGVEIGDYYLINRYKVPSIIAVAHYLKELVKNIK